MTAEDFFRKLIMLPSPSWHEEEAAAYIRKAMEGYGYFLKEDGHGNMLFYRSTEGEKLMFAAHMDTVDKAVSPAAVETEDCFMTDGTTALGADDKCAVAAMLASAAAGPDVLFLFRHTSICHSTASQRMQDSSRRRDALPCSQPLRRPWPSPQEG